MLHFKMLKTIIIMVLTVQFIAHGADSTSVQVSGTVNLGCGGAINKSNPLSMHTFFKVFPHHVFCWYSLFIIARSHCYYTV